MKYLIHRESFFSSLNKIWDEGKGILANNLINIKEDELDTPIYRILSLEAVVDILCNNRLRLVRPKKWDDPFENWLLRSKFILKDGTETSIISSQSFVGQCWSITKESDAMWRIYSPNKTGIKIKSTIRKLLEALLNNIADDSRFEISKFIGKVKYLEKEKIIDEFRHNAKAFSTTNLGQAMSHYYKRIEFQHENEVRILFKTHKDVFSDAFFLPISPFELIDEMVLDPRLDIEKCQNLIEYIKAMGYTYQISQSQLYNFEDIKLDIDL